MGADRIHIQLDVRVPMRDGVPLSADIYRPVGDGPFPVALCRTIYDNQNPGYPHYVQWAYEFARRGYAAVVVDCRGRSDSDGVWNPYVCEAVDGYDTQQWIGQQPWCDGNIGTFGISYIGFTQVQPAPLRSPYVKALVPIMHQEDNYDHLYCDGVLELQNAVNFGKIGRRTMHGEAWQRLDRSEIYRRLPLISALDDILDVPLFRHFVSHWKYDDYWRSYSLKEKYPEIETPALFITGWYDNLLRGTLRSFSGWKYKARQPAREKTRILIGPWSHLHLGSATPFGDIDFGPAAAVDIPDLHVRWYDRRLRGIENGIDGEGPVRLFVMGTNVWRDEQEWPLARTQYRRYYLHSRGRASSGRGDGELDTTPPADEPVDHFTYDPANPAPTLGGQSMFAENTGPRDRRSVEERDDVLVYTTEPLAGDLEVTGPVEMLLYAASTAVDTDFTATLVDVHPDGKAINICEGVVRTRFRTSSEQPTPIEPGKVYAYTISLWATSNVFKAGHRIRLEVSSSNFPRFNRNLNTGEDFATGTRMETARQTILHNRQYPSHVVLPIIPV